MSPFVQDKKNVDAYKASIKAQLSKAGLIRGQPRHNPLQVPALQVPVQRSTAQRAKTPSTRTSQNSPAGLNGLRQPSFESSFSHLVETPFPQNHNDHLLPAMPGEYCGKFKPWLKTHSLLISQVHPTPASISPEVTILTQTSPSRILFHPQHLSFTPSDPILWWIKDSAFSILHHRATICHSQNHCSPSTSHLDKRTSMRNW